MFARAGLLHDPFTQLPVGIGQVAERAQWYKGFLDILDARLNDSLLLRVVRWTCVDPEAVSLSERGVRALDLRAVHAGSGDCTLRVVDDDATRTAAEPLESAAVAGQPCLDGLIEHELNILVPRPAEGHDEVYERAPLHELCMH